MLKRVHLSHGPAAAMVSRLESKSSSLSDELAASRKTVAELEQKVSALQAEIDDLKKAREEEKKQTMDTDGDGVVDAVDACSDTPKGAVVDDRGCEKDSDGDGITDRLDLCGDTAQGVAVNSLGCPADSPIILERVTFRSGTAELTDVARKTLEKIARILKTSAPGQQFEVAGYTDSVGDPTLNLNISEKRAKAVRIFLIKQGVQANLLVPKGYGMENPIADNKTAEGRARNRRVELHQK